MTSSAPARVLLLRFSAVGDIILTAAAVQALKRAWPESRILFATKARLGCLVVDNPHIDEVVGLEPGESFWHFRQRLAACRPTAILDLHDKLRSVALIRSLAAERKRVWQKRPFLAGLKARLGIGTYRAGSLLADRYHQAVEALVDQALPVGELRYYVRDDARERVGAMLRDVGVDLSRPIVGMAPSAMWATKRWPPERYALLAQRAFAQGYQVVLSGSADEAVVTRFIAERAPEVIDLAGRLTLADLGAFIERCRAFVANDSGPMHLSRALGVPTLAFFGSTDPAQFDFTGHALMFAGLGCAPCSFYGRARCPKGHFRCMLDLDLDQAWAALLTLCNGPHRVPWVRG